MHAGLSSGLDIEFDALVPTSVPDNKGMSGPATVYFIPKSRKPTLYLGLITAMCFAGPVQNQSLPKI